MGCNVDVGTIIEKVFASFKKITPFLAVISLVSGGLLFLPTEFLGKIGFENLSQPWKRGIGLVFLVSTVLILVIGIFRLFEKMHKKLKYKKTLRNLRKKFMQLKGEPRKIILELMSSPDKKISLDHASGNTIYLMELGFIYRPMQVVSVDYNDHIYAEYVPHPWLIDLHDKEPKLFEE